MKRSVHHKKSRAKAAVHVKVPLRFLTIYRLLNKERIGTALPQITPLKEVAPRFPGKERKRDPHRCPIIVREARSMHLALRLQANDMRAELVIALHNRLLGPDR